MKDRGTRTATGTGRDVEPRAGRRYTAAQAADLLGVSATTVRRWVRAGRLAALPAEDRTLRIPEREVRRLLRAGPAGRVPRPRWLGTDGAGHVVQFYETDAFLLDTVAEFIGAGLRAGEAAVVLATPAHRRGLAERLEAAGVDVAAAREAGRYAALDAAETLAGFLVDGMPDPDRFARAIGATVARAASGGRRVRLFGEMVALLTADGNGTGAVRLEELWNGLLRSHPCTLLCAYPLEQMSGEGTAELFHQVCAEHARVIPTEGYTALSTDDDRLRTITLLQQKARRLETEIAHRQQAEARLQEALAAERAAREAAEAALRLRDEFLSIAAHELRTPLTSLRGYAQMAQRRLTRDGGEPERLAQSLQAITGQVDKLARLITQLLDVSRLEAGRLTLEREPTDLTALVEQAATAARTATDRHVITVDAPASVEARVDPLRLEQVLANLLDNAVKYSPDGGRVEVTLSEPRDGAVELSVRDHGLGIPPEQRGRIFERFHQAHGSGYRSGMGLGLYISRQIVELHGGEVRAEFPPDGGTRIVVRLPVEAVEAAAGRGSR
ncbi:MAG TPA: ATP-binding protein [Dehalococcoidia bacterium]